MPTQLLSIAWLCAASFLLGAAAPAYAQVNPYYQHMMQQAAAQQAMYHQQMQYAAQQRAWQIAAQQNALKATAYQHEAQNLTKQQQAQYIQQQASLAARQASTQVAAHQNAKQIAGARYVSANQVPVSVLQITPQDRALAAQLDAQLTYMVKLAEKEASITGHYMSIANVPGFATWTKTTGYNPFTGQRNATGFFALGSHYAHGGGGSICDASSCNAGSAGGCGGGGCGD
jgi:hypothetical protein